MSRLFALTLRLIGVTIIGAAVIGDAGATAIKTLNSGHCLAIEGGIDRPDGAPLILQACDAANPAQIFRMPGDGTIRIGERCVDAKTAQGNPGDQVIVWSCHSGPNQRWEYMGLGLIRGINFLCMDVKGGGGEGTSVMVWRCHGGKNQRWGIE